MNNVEWCKENCPYYPDCYGAGVCNYVVAILKEHESVKPVRRTEEIEWTVCGFCEKHLISKWAFCPYCGRAVKWNDIQARSSFYISSAD